MSIKASGLGVLTGITPASLQQLLFILRNANMQSTADQAFVKSFTGTAFAISNVIAKRVSGAATVACLGGIYDGAAKTGNILVAAAQSWVTLAAGVIVAGVPLPVQGAATPILSLSTGSTGACVADLFIYGAVID